MRWGLVPFFYKEINSKYTTINAKAETVAENNAYKGPFKSRWCLIPAGSFYEWQKGPGKTKQPMRIMLKSGTYP
jgi:putative SOS response-associated peptidase YedK